MDRRHFLLGVGAAAGSTLLTPPPAIAADWNAVRREFQLDPGLTNLALFYLASHPRPVRLEIERLRRKVDANTHDLDPQGAQKVATALAGYIGGQPGDIAFVPNTTTGLGIIYNGLKIRADQEILINDQDHYSQRESARLAAEKTGATLRVVSLFADSAKATVDEVASTLRKTITPKTRAIGMTWVHSSTGVKMPIRAIADVVAEANRNRAEADRCLLIVDGVHGLAAVNEDAARLGADVFVAGTHKWLFAPRGTGLIWVKPDASQHFRPTVPSFDSRSATSRLGPGGFVAFEHLQAVPAAVAFHQRLGRPRVAARVVELSDRLKDGLSRIPGMIPRTPRSSAMSAGITCFDLQGVQAQRVVDHLATKHIQITTATYRIPYVRIGTAIINTPAEIDAAVKAVAEVR